LVFSVSITSCSVMRQANELKTLAKCDFRIYNMEGATLAGVKIDDVNRMSDISLLEITKIMGAFASGNLPLDFILNIQVLNPNGSVAALNRLDWILYIDEIEMTRGILSKRIEIPPDGGMETIPVEVSFNLNQALDGKTADALVNFALNLSEKGERPTRILVKAKPTIYVSGSPIDYPGYIRIRNEFGAR